MVLESTMVCVDSSDFMRNGDFLPSRLQAQQDAVNLICHSKTRSNPENNVGLMTMSGEKKVLTTLTSDVGRIFTKLHPVEALGELNFISSVKIAHLSLKHRQGKNHKMRIVAFVGSPMEDDEKELVKLAKRLKKEKVNVDIINFGEDALNTDKLTAFINTINGKDGTSSHLVTVSQGPMLSDALISSPIIVGEDGAAGGAPGGGHMQGFEFGIDPNEDPELALALRVSMEEQRARQEAPPAAPAETPATAASSEPNTDSVEVSLARALDMSVVGETPATPAGQQPPLHTPAAPRHKPVPAVPAETPVSAAATTVPDFSNMTEEEQIAYAMQLSMTPAPDDSSAPEMMETDDDASKKAETEEGDEEDMSSLMNDPAFLQGVLEGLPGVDPDSEAIRSAMGQLQGEKKSDQDKNDKK